MNTFSTTAGIVYLQSQPMLNPYPSPFTGYVLPSIFIRQWVWKEVTLKPAQILRGTGNVDMERAGKIYMALADEDAALAELGLDEYGRLLDNDLRDVA